MALDQKDLDLIERIIYKNGDDIVVGIARSFERLEQRIDGAESRLFSRIADIEDAIGFVDEKIKEDIMDGVNALSAEVKAMRSIVEDKSEAGVFEE